MVYVVSKMDRRRNSFSLSIIGLIIVIASVSAAGCAGPRQIAAPDAKELRISKVGETEQEGITLGATILDEDQVIRLLSVDVTRHDVVPVIFVMSNQAETSYLIRREHFRLEIGELHIEPVLPGRAAALLRDSSESQGAAWAGYFVFGILAAPSIHTAEKKETASVEAHREAIFSEAPLTPGSTITGYLFFESPTPLKKVQRFELELRISGNTDNSISVQLSNPYATSKGK